MDARANVAAMSEATAYQRVYKRLLSVQVDLQDAGDEEAHDVLCDHVLDPFWSLLHRKGLEPERL